MSKSNTRALVLSGGGFVGGAWMLGLIDGLRAGGVDLAKADLIVGTSAGARTGAQLATGRLSPSVEMFRNGEAPPVDAPAGLDRFVAASTRIAAETADEQE